MAAPAYRKDEMGDTFSERTYHNEPTHYNIELDRLRSQIPDAQATKPRSMEYGYDSRYDNINNAPPPGSRKALKRAEKVYATMCCGSCCGFAAWVIGALIVIAIFVVLLLKVLNHQPAASVLAPESTSAGLVQEQTTTVTQSLPSSPMSTITTSTMSTETSITTSVSTLTSVTVTTETYSPPSTIISTVTSDGETVTLTSVATSVVTTSQAPIPTSVETETVTSVATTTEMTTTSDISTTTADKTISKNRNDDDDDESIISRKSSKVGSTMSTPKSTIAATTQTPGIKPSTSAAQPPPIPEVPKICSTASRLENMWTASSVGKDAQSRLASAVAAKAPKPTLQCLASLTSLYNAAWSSDLRYCATASKTDTSRCSKEIQRRTGSPRR